MKFKKNLQERKVAFVTLGCKVNQYETDKIMEEFIQNGWRVVDFTEIADVYIVNSCSVTNLATRKTRNYLSRAKKLGGVVVLIGCYAQELSTKEEAEKILNVDIILGNYEKTKVFDIVNNYLKENKSLFEVSNIGEYREYNESSIKNEAFNIRESVKIEDGCNNFCSYCIIPYVRGRVRSRKLENIISEIEKLVETGVKEVVLVGIEIASYGKDLDYSINLIDVIEEVNKIEGLERIRLGSIEPRILTDDNIKRLSKIPKLCHHFHISVQSMDDSVLKNMNRKYDSYFVIDVINKIRKYFDDVAITCDIIVGFPKESDKQFENTLNNVEKVGFYEVHSFKYSKRKWTVAAKMDGQVDSKISDLRSKKLVEVANCLKKKYMEKFLGKSYPVLFESYKDGYLEGYTSNYIKVKAKGDNFLWGKIQEVELYSIEKDYMLGNILQ